MSYVRCPRCGLSVYPRYSVLTLRYCPRCIARRREPVLMEAPQRPASGRDVDRSQAGPSQQRMSNPARPRSLTHPASRVELASRAAAAAGGVRAFGAPVRVAAEKAQRGAAGREGAEKSSSERTVWNCSMPASWSMAGPRRQRCSASRTHPVRSRCVSHARRARLGRWSVAKVRMAAVGCRTAPGACASAAWVRAARASQRVPR